MLREELQKSISTEANKHLTLLESSSEFDAYRKKPSLEEMFSYDSKGFIKQTNENCQLVLEYDELLKGAIRFNELTGKMDIVKDVPWKRFSKTFSDNDLDNIITYFEMNYGLKVDKYIERAIRIAAKENSYHPIRDFLNTLSWDGVDRISNVLTKYLGVEPTPLAIESLKLFMLGAISRVFQPGCKFEYMLCLVGGQGAGKSTFLRFLAINDSWFTDDLKKLSDKDVHEHLNGHWIIEIPEMVALLHAKCVEETKSFISRQTDNYRIPYDKFSDDHDRQCVFAGTSNRIEFLPDDKSGNRRFLPIKVNAEKAEIHILEDEEESRAYFIQLWAQAMDVYRKGEYKLTLSKDMLEVLYAEQQQYLPDDPKETAILNFIENKCPEYICAKMLHVEALGHSINDDMPQWESVEIGAILNNALKDEYKKIGSHRFKEYGKQRTWARIVEPSDTEFEPIQEDEESPFVD